MRQEDAHRAFAPAGAAGFPQRDAAVAPMHARRSRTPSDMRVILVATDGSPAAAAALDEALALAAQTGDGIAVSPSGGRSRGTSASPIPPTAVLADLLDAEREHAEATLANAAERAKPPGSRSSRTSRPETPPSRSAPTRRSRCAADRDRHAWARVGASLLLGSVSQSVVREAPCPVLVVRDSERTRDETHPPHLEVSR